MLVRLGLALTLAVVIGVSTGVGKHFLVYHNVDENMADFRAVAAPVMAPDRSTTTEPGVSPGGQPRVEVVGGASHDFGTMQQGSKKSHDFVFRNSGTGPLTLAVAGSSCRCTIGTLADSQLEPGQETKVSLEWEARGVLDKFGQTATISTNDPGQSRVLLSVKGTVLRTVLMEPQTIALGDISASSEYKSRIRVFSYDPEPMVITSVKWADDRTADKVQLEVKEVPVDKSAFPAHADATSAAEVDLKIAAGLPLGIVDTRITMETNIKTVPSIDLSVSGNVVGDIQIIGGPMYEADKHILALGAVDRKTGTKTQLFFSVQGPARETVKLEVGSVEPKESLQVSIGEPKVQSSRLLYPITISVPENAPSAMYPGTNPSNFGKIKILSNHPNIPTISIYVRLIVE